MPEAPHESDISSPADQALAWCVRLNSGDVTANERAAFRRWLAADAAHEREYEKARRLWGEIGMAADPRRIARRRVLMGLTGGAAAAAVASFAGLPDFLTSDHYSDVGERKTVSLDDGSQVELDAYTALSVDFSSAVRRIVLRRGRALFLASQQSHRPFQVLPGTGSVTTAGGEFVVHRSNDVVTIAVLKATVSVATPSTGALMQLGSGRQLTYGASAASPVETATKQEEVAWRRGRLVFEDQMLERVVADLNRYRRGRIVLGDDTLASLRVSGTFDLDQPGDVLDALESALSLRAWRLSNYLVVLRRA